MSALLELAERCEAAMGPDRELDIAIIVTIDWRHSDWEEGDLTAKEMAERHGLAWLVSRSVEGYNSMWRHLPRFTASLDAALTLVPEGWETAIYLGGENANVQMETEDMRRRADFYPIDATSATGALAICAAALKARAASAIEAATAGETPQDGSTEGESAVPTADAQPLPDISTWEQM